LELELLTVAMASGGRRRTEGCSMAQVGEEGVTSGFKMSSTYSPRRWRAAAWLSTCERRWPGSGRQGGGGGAVETERQGGGGVETKR
jgi:hypothetical protein